LLNQLKKVEKSNELIEIYTKEGDLSKFLVAKVLKVSDEWVVVTTITTKGMYDGFLLIRLDDVLRLNFKTKYIEKANKLYTAKKQKHAQYNEVQEDLLLGFLEFAQLNNFIVSVQLLSSEDFDVQGYIKEIEKDLLIIETVNNYGEYDGESYLKLEDINMMTCDDEDDYCLKILSSNTLN
jgi:hypothetical protein